MMTAVEFIHAELKRLHGMLDKAIGDLTPAQLHTVPANHPKASTLAWIFWHYARTEDNVVRFVLQNRRATDRRATSERVPDEDGEAGAARQLDRAAQEGRAPLPGNRRLRGERAAADRERDPLRPGHRLPGRARSGQDTHGAPLDRAARQRDAGGCR